MTDTTAPAARPQGSWPREVEIPDGDSVTVTRDGGAIEVLDHEGDFIFSLRCDLDDWIIAKIVSFGRIRFDEGFFCGGRAARRHLRSWLDCDREELPNDG
jgi:hypothetical protein